VSKNGGYGYEAKEGNEGDEGYGKDWTIQSGQYSPVLSLRLHNDAISKD